MSTSDGKFLAVLQQRAALSITPLLSQVEWLRLENIADRSFRFQRLPCQQPDMYVVHSAALYAVVKLARQAIVDRTKKRMIG